MATTTRTFTWDSDNEGFTLTESAGAGTFSRDTGNGSPTNGSLLQDGETGRNKTGEGQALINDGSWESIFGIPTGSTVTAIQIEDVRTYAGLTAWVAGDTVDFNVHILDSTGATSVTGTDPIWSRNVTAADGSWQSAGQQTAQNVTSTYQASNTTIDVLIHIATANLNDPTAHVTGHLDYLSITVTYDAGATTQTGSFNADAILLAPQSATVQADAVVERTQEAASNVDAILLHLGQAGAFTLDAEQLDVVAGSFAVDALVFKEVAGSFDTDAVVLAVSTGTFTLDANVVVVVELSFTADASIAGSSQGASTIDAVVSIVGPCIWVSPANLAGMSATDTLVWLMPPATGNIHFQIELDTDSGFSAPTVVQSPGTGWEYWNGSGWQPIPDGGVPNTYAGNEARYTIQSPLSQGTWYRRVRAGVIS